MPIQEQHYQITGMKQDNLVGTGFSTKFAHEIKNMRLNTIGDYTTGAWTTEKGTKEMTVYTYTSEKYQDREPANNPIANYFPIINSIVDLKTLKVLGQAVINEQWILFGNIRYDIGGGQKYENVDCILRLFISNNTLYCEVLYFGNLNFDFNHPLETLTYFENEDIQKVYFTDGINQPRMINVVNVKHRFGDSLDTLETQFDFVREVALNEKVTIKKLQSGSGLFPPCTVKYAITYYDKYGSETNVVYDSPLYYPTKGERGCSPEELSGDSFEITVSDLDTNFDYIRLYSIVRTSDDATPIVRIVADKAVPPASLTRRSVTFVDTNTTGEIIDPNVLRYVGGRNITAQTFDQKSNALFLGNIELKTKSISSLISSFNENYNPGITWELYKSVDGSIIPIKQRYFLINNVYPYTNQLTEYYYINNSTIQRDTIQISSQHIKHFKKGEYYHFGLQFQDKYGVWSEVVSNKHFNKENTENYNVAIYNEDYFLVNFSCPKITLNSQTISMLRQGGYRKVRLVCAKKNNTNRKVIAQGIIDSTVYEQSTYGNNPFRYASWFFRPREFYFNGTFDGVNPQKDITFGYDDFNNIDTRYVNYFEDDEYPTSILNNYTVEVQNEGCNGQDVPKWKVDRTWVTFHSPELEFDDSLKTLSNDNLQCNIIGYIPINKAASNYRILGSQPEINNENYSHIETFSISDSLDAYEKHKVHYYCNQAVAYRLGSASYRVDIYPFQNNDMGSNAGYDYKIFSSELISDYPILEGTKDVTFTNGWEALKNNFLNGDFKIFEKNSTDYIALSNTQSLASIYSGNTKTIAPFVNTYPEFGQDTATWVSKPISITYKTTTHAVFNTDTTTDVLDNEKNVSITYHSVEENRPYLWLTEISKGGQDNDEDTKNLIFTPCSPAYKLPESGDLNIYGLEGDHYYMRYDCLKTFPYSTSDKNQIVEILSFMCETRVNLDGRYDTKRGLMDNTSVLDTNFNLINKSYTQDNDFYQYTTLDDLSAKLDKFSNQITYTSVKIANEDVDAWTNITLANVDDADGGCGQITKILNINDKLFLFQDHGIARINYDEKTALSTDSGIPIELNSSGKYTGIDYINKNIGCQNKWSISNTKNGLMWIDDSRRELLALDESLTSITTLNGFDAFMIQNCNTETPWNPNDFNNFITFYDKLSKDIYFINRDTCLAWNEIPKTFTSFYDYNQVSALATINKSTLMFRNTNNNGSIYAAREANEYSYFFNETKPYWITLVCDGSSNQNNNFSLDKVFDTIEYRADIYNLDGSNTNYAKSIFNKKHVWNGYQDSEECDLDGVRKFNTWRVQLPRHKGTRDRIRNPFCYIKLKEDRQGRQAQTERVILHDLAVSYTIK